MGRGLGPGSGAVGWCYVCVRLDSLCRWQVQVSASRVWVHVVNRRVFSRSNKYTF